MATHDNKKKALSPREVLALPAACPVADAAAALGICEDTLYSWIAAGRKPGGGSFRLDNGLVVMPVGRKIKVQTASVIRYLGLEVPAAPLAAAS